MDDSGHELSRRYFESSRFMMARAAVQVDHMMRVGAKIGTGRAFGQRYGQLLASKTGTTDDGRDAWFVGADGRRLGVAWVGFDDNRKAGLVGSVAALPVIAGAIQFVQRSDRSKTLPEGLMYGWMNRSGQIVDQSCEGAEKRPLPIEYRPAQAGFCGGGSLESPSGSWLDNWFGG